MAGVAAVVGNSHKALAPEIILGLTGQREPDRDHRCRHANQSGERAIAHGRRAAHTTPIWADDRFAHSFIEEAQLVPGEQTRPNLKIQEGCGNRCTFCVIPQTRGSSKSLPRAAVMRQVEGFVAAGGNELVLSGINLGRWGRELPAVGRPTQASPGRAGPANLPRNSAAPSPPQLHRAHGLGRRPDRPPRRVRRNPPRSSRASAPAVRFRRRLRRMHRRYRPWHYAEKVDALASGRRSRSHPWRRCHGRLPRRNRRRIRRDRRPHSRSALRLSAPVSLLAAPGHARLGLARRIARRPAESSTSACPPSAPSPPKKARPTERVSSAATLKPSPSTPRQRSRNRTAPPPSPKTFCPSRCWRDRRPASRQSARARTHHRARILKARLSPRKPVIACPSLSSLHPIAQSRLAVAIWLDENRQPSFAALVSMRCVGRCRHAARASFARAAPASPQDSKCDRGHDGRHALAGSLPRRRPEADRDSRPQVGRRSR